MSQSLTDKTISGLNWNFISNYGTAIIGTILGIVLARLLTPKDFGLLGMVTVFTGLADLFATLGMGQSIIRIKNITNNHVRVATTLTMTSSFLIYLLFYFSSPFIADFYNEQRLIPILKILSLLFLVKGVMTVSYNQIQKSLDFKAIMFIGISSSVTYGVVSSVLAIIGFGVWSLVYGSLASSTLACFLTLKKFPPNLKPLIKKNELKELLGFGTGVSLSNVLLYASSNIDILLIGKFLNSFMLGLYTRALNLMRESITKITGGIYNVLFPAFAAVQDDPQKLRKAYLRTIRTVSFFVFPVLASMVVSAHYVIKGLYSAKWSGAITSFQILGIAGILRTTLSYSGAIAHATGKVYAEAMQQLVYFLILSGCAFFALKFGIEGIAVSIVIASLWLFIAQSWLAIKIIESSWKEFFIELIPGFTNSIFMIFFNLILDYSLETFYYNAANEIKLIVTVFFNAIVFILVIVFMPSFVKGDTFDWLIGKYKKFIPSPFIKFYLLFNTQK